MGPSEAFIDVGRPDTGLVFADELFRKKTLLGDLCDHLQSYFFGCDIESFSAPDLDFERKAVHVRSLELMFVNADLRGRKMPRADLALVQCVCDNRRECFLQGVDDDRVDSVHIVNYCVGHRVLLQVVGFPPKPTIDKIEKQIKNPRPRGPGNRFVVNYTYEAVQCFFLFLQSFTLTAASTIMPQSAPNVAPKISKISGSCLLKIENWDFM
ncbi:MAG: hypothetical protein JWN37_872 [Candidatus Nomurabacteria bacterium]|nr:hypothetical protein [Candidatus Nomurabacteria bacterium]